MDMNKGYSGWSMSKRAVEAYDGGEMPKSKWTKGVILDCLRKYCEDNYLEYDYNVVALSKEQLFDQYIMYSSWHHTSKFANKTDFYSLDEDAVRDRFPDMSEDRKQQVKEYRHERAMEIVARQMERQASEKARREMHGVYKKVHGFDSNTVAAYVKMYPDNVKRKISRRGNEVVEILSDKDPEHAGVFEARKIKYTWLHNFDALKEENDYEQIRDYVWSRLPEDEYENILAQEYCELDWEFLGFLDNYNDFKLFVPEGATVIDLGCYVSTQAYLFQDCEKYIGVDVVSDALRFHPENSEQYVMRIQDFIKDKATELDLSNVYAICSAVLDTEATNMAFETFNNVYVQYPGREARLKIDGIEIDMAGRVSIASFNTSIFETTSKTNGIMGMMAQAKETLEDSPGTTVVEKDIER